MVYRCDCICDVCVAAVQCERQCCCGGGGRCCEWFIGVTVCVTCVLQLSRVKKACCCYCCYGHCCFDGMNGLWM